MCVTNSDTNLCGGGNDIFSSTAAKLIQSGENFDTTLSSTVSSAGSYWFHIEVQYGSDSSRASQSFTAAAETSDTPSGGGTGGSGGSGGGGGGGVAAVSLPSITTTCDGADFNHDKKVNSIDFSILLAFWKTIWPFKNSCVDTNSDKQVNSVDFSILMYQWGTRK